MGAIELVEVFMSLPAAVACVLVSLFRFSLHFPPFSAFSAFPALFTLFTRMPLATIQPLQKPIETTQKLSGTQAPPTDHRWRLYYSAALNKHLC